MNTYLIEYKKLTKIGYPDIDVFYAKSDGQAQDKALNFSDMPNRIYGEFEMYRILRNSDGELYLADCDCRPIPTFP